MVSDLWQCTFSRCNPLCCQCSASITGTYGPTFESGMFTFCDTNSNFSCGHHWISLFRVTRQKLVDGTRHHTHRLTRKRGFIQRLSICLKTSLHAARKKTKLTKLLIFKHAASSLANAVSQPTWTIYDVTCTDIWDLFLRLEGTV